MFLTNKAVTDIGRNKVAWLTAADRAIHADLMEKPALRGCERLYRGPNTSSGATQTIAVDRNKSVMPTKTGTIVLKSGR